MRTLNLYGFLEDIEARKRELGVDESPRAVEMLRNRGGSRTPAKRRLLQRTENRARAAGAATVRSYY
jgi:hypothetical protein